MGQSHSSAYIDSNAALEAVRDGDASRVQGIIRALKKREATSSQEGMFSAAAKFAGYLLLIQNCL